MGILNVTPDSFFEQSRAFDEEAVAKRVGELLADKPDIIDIGACSTRPGSSAPSVDEEIARLRMGMQVLRKIDMDIIVSVDTYRSAVAAIAVKELGCDIVNDISGTNLDPEMAETVAGLGCPYILTHMRGTPADMNEYAKYEDVTADVLSEIGDRVQWLALAGVNDIIIDPGFGFAKTAQQNCELMHDLGVFQLLHRPILVGVSRKSMVSKITGTTAGGCLAGTVALQTIALQNGADILRVHDVGAARQAVDIYCAIKQAGKDA